MATSDLDDNPPLSPAQARMLARVRRLMLISGMATVLGIAVVVTVIGYRVFGSEGSAGAADIMTVLPKGSRVVSTAVAGERIVVTLDIAGATEIRIFDARTLQPHGRLRFAVEP
jgi:hypothetical protein